MIANLGIDRACAGRWCRHAFVMAILGGTQKRPEYVESARRAAVVVMPLLTLACLSVIYLNLVGDYSVEYTYRVSNSTTPVFLRITALWGGQNGSILFWNWLMSLYVFFVFLRPWKSNRDLLRGSSRCRSARRPSSFC
jgi:cytochrome c-type biogenesis protein CcmF